MQICAKLPFWTRNITKLLVQNCLPIVISLFNRDHGWTASKVVIIFRLQSYVYWTVHHLHSWIKIDQLDVTCFIISLFTAQHVSNVRISIFRSLRLIADLFHVLYCSVSMCVGVTVWFGWVVWCPYAGWSCASACIRIPTHIEPEQ